MKENGAALPNWKIIYLFPQDELERELQELTAKLREERSAGQALALQLEKQKTLYSNQGSALVC